MARCKRKFDRQIKELQMNKAIIFSVLILNLIFFNACTSETESVKRTETNSPTNLNSGSVQTSNSNANSLENGSTMPTPMANIQGVNVSSNTPINTQKPLKKGESNTNEKPKTTFVPAAHNSAIGTMMSESGDFLTIRVFNSHPQIQKLEQNEVTKKVKIFLKNGKTVEATVDGKINFMEAAPQEILIAVGLAKPTPTPDSSQTSGK